MFHHHAVVVVGTQAFYVSQHCLLVSIVVPDIQLDWIEDSLPCAVSRSLFPMRILTVRGLESDEDIPRTTSSIRAGRQPLQNIVTACHTTPQQRYDTIQRTRCTVSCIIAVHATDAAPTAAVADEYSLPHPMPLLQTMSIGQPMLISTKSERCSPRLALPPLSSYRHERPRFGLQTATHLLSHTHGAEAVHSEDCPASKFFIIAISPQVMSQPPNTDRR